MPAPDGGEAGALLPSPLLLLLVALMLAVVLLMLLLMVVGASLAVLWPPNP